MVSDFELQWCVCVYVCICHAFTFLFCLFVLFYTDYLLSKEREKEGVELDSGSVDWEEMRKKKP